MFTFKPIYTLLLLSVYVSTILAESSLVERALPSRTVKCEWNSYDANEIQDAIDTGVRRFRDTEFPGTYMTFFLNFGTCDGEC